MYWSIFMLWPILKTLFYYQPMLFLKGPVDDVPVEYTPVTLSKIHNNIISAIHSCLAVISTSMYLYSYSTEWLYISSILSFSYFTWDTYTIIIQKTSENYPYILHHVIALIIIQEQLLNYNRNLLISMFCIAEFSNFPIYAIYHLKKIGYTHNMPYLQLCQLLWFGFFRIVVLGFYLDDCITLIHHNLPLISLLIIYILGVYWTLCQFKGVYAQYITRNYIKKLI